MVLSRRVTCQFYILHHLKRGSQFHFVMLICMQVQGKFRILYSMPTHTNLRRCLYKLYPNWMTTEAFQDFLTDVLVLTASDGCSKIT